MEHSAEKPEKNPAAVTLGRLGGLKGGKARAEKLTISFSQDNFNSARIRAVFVAELIERHKTSQRETARW